MAKRGAEAFDAFYADLFGGRWPGLREALLAAGAPVAFEHGLVKPYYLDAASVVAAAALDVKPGDRVLDLCAAPGGKSLVLAAALAGGDGGPRGELVCNERSSARRARLHRVLDEHLPPETRALVRVTPHDAGRWALYEPASYDRVLADVPCSSEQHVLQSAGALAEWSPSRTKRLAKGAYAIACAAVDSVRSGGRVVYSTCALSPGENDGVIARLIDRGDGTVAAADPREAVGAAIGRYASLHPAFAAVASGGAERSRSAPEAPRSLPGSETEHGWTFLPDEETGLGPIYLAVLERAR